MPPSNLRQLLSKYAAADASKVSTLPDYIEKRKEIARRASAQALQRPNPTEYKDLADFVQEKTGMSPTTERRALLPSVNAKKVVAPEALYSATKAMLALEAARRGVPMSGEDAANWAQNFGVIGGGAAHAGSTSEHAGTLGVVKPKGFQGNWLKGDVEQNIINKLKAAPRFGERDPERLRNIGLIPEAQKLESELATNSWLDTALTKYFKNEMGTPEDRVRALAERGVTHQAIPELRGQDVLDVANRRNMSGYPVEGLAKSPAAKLWEDYSDLSIYSRPAKRFSGPIMDTDPWLATVPPETPVYEPLHHGMVNRQLGFDVLRDTALDLTNPSSNIPEQFRLTPEQLSRVSVPQMVEKTHAINEIRGKQAAAERLAQMERSGQLGTVHKEYPESRGMRWVEYTLPKEDPGPQFVKPKGNGFVPVNAKGEEFTELDPIAKTSKIIEPRPTPQEAHLKGMLVTEGNLMGHCIGRYCDEIKGGEMRAFSLKDAAGEPHATIEVGPGPAHIPNEVRNRFMEQAADEAEYQGLADDAPGYNDFIQERIDELGETWYPGASSKEGKQEIKQIKGKSNEAPVEKYLPYVQDFVKSGDWGDIRAIDAPNAGLRRMSQAFSPEEIDKARQTLDLPEHGWLTGDQLQSIWETITPPEVKAESGLRFNARGELVPIPEEGFAEGGTVNWADKIARLGRKAQYALSDLTGMGPEIQFATETPAKYFPKSEQHNQRGDAMRHMLFQAQLMQKYGETPAKMISWAHENMSGPQGESEKEMDVYNDELGRAIGRDSKSKDDMISRALQSIKEGEAKTLTEEQANEGYAQGGSVRQYDPQAIEALVNQLHEGIQ